MKHPSNHPNIPDGARRQRATLTSHQAVQIYALRMPSTFQPDSECAGSAKLVAAKFNVSLKAVRDIWNRRTWADETSHLW
eukprot:CAMPEP_0113700334 /NCGR_PEP_ID=MMETSP0038_2-20120614/23895_1 /TAXON_ID=2898 /ORGANISM="Cryptomonas paramecium" /LENGTH=79 /DNA_ID=CAMNT_0000623971 /DNA_START=17 /DNA_END=253 /DNA_ORIENTATION=- /assembly_acc=CAM_ASM_000170